MRFLDMFEGHFPVKLAVVGDEYFPQAPLAMRTQDAKPAARGCRVTGIRPRELPRIAGTMSRGRVLIQAGLHVGVADSAELFLNRFGRADRCQAILRVVIVSFQV